MGLFSSIFGSQERTSIPPPGPEETQLTGDLAAIVANLREDLERVRTPEELNAALAPIFDLQARRGSEDIQTKAIELAGRSGLNLGDSPVANVALRQQRELTEGLGAARASAILDLQQRAITNRLNLGQLSLGGIGTLGSIRTRQPTVTSTPSPFQAGVQVAGGLGGLLGGESFTQGGLFSLFQ